MKKTITLLLILFVAATTTYAQQKKAPEDLIQQIEKGSDLFSDQKFDEAGEVFLAALNKYPDQYLPVLGLLKVSAAYQNQEKIDEAISWLERALKVATDKGGLNVALATIYIQQKNYEQAVDYLHQAVKVAPDSPQVIGPVLSCYASMNRFDDESRKIAEQIMEKAPLDAHMFLGLWCQKNKLYDEAKNHYLKAVMLNTNDPQSRLMLGRLYEEMGKTDLAEREYMKVIRIVPNHPAGYTCLAELYKKTGQDDLAKQYAEQARQLRDAYMKEAQKARDQQAQNADEN